MYFFSPCSLDPKEYKCPRSDITNVCATPVANVAINFLLLSLLLLCVCVCRERERSQKL